MKRIPFIAVAALVVALFSCDKEDVSPVDVQQPEWKLTYAGFQKLENHKTLTKQLKDTLVNVEADVLLLDCPPEACHFFFYRLASIPDKYDGMTPAQMASSIVDEFFTGATGYDSLVLNKRVFNYEDTVLFTGMMAGDYIVYAFEVDSMHVPTGKYASCAFNKADNRYGELSSVPTQFVSDWTVSLLDSTLCKKLDKNGIDSTWSVGVQVTAPGIIHFYLAAMNPFEFYQAYSGSIGHIMSAIEVYIGGQLNSGKAITDIFRKGVETPRWINYNKSDKKRVYIMEYDEEGKATGRYGLSEVELPPLP